jgi:hypothetical protein
VGEVGGGLRIADCGFGILNLGFGIWDLGFGIWKLGFGIWKLEIGIWNYLSCDGTVAKDIRLGRVHCTLD